MNLTCKSWMIFIILFGCFNLNAKAQKTNTNASLTASQADRDWEALIFAMSDLGGFQYEIVEDGPALAYWTYYDGIAKKRSQLAKAFFYNYPQDERHDEALYTFFHFNAKPWFIPKVVPDSLTQLLASIPRREYKRTHRLLPHDDAAREAWCKTGNDMVASILNSNATLERKATAEFQLICREFTYAAGLVSPLVKEKQEASYWGRFETQYWKHIQLRLEDYVKKYASLSIVANQVQVILDAIRGYSTVAPEVYWKRFFDMTGADSPLADQAGIKALHKMAAENIAAMAALKETDLTKPLEMAFTAMDGTKIDLANMRGKVVLIDFWATNCGPCIEEMPHVRAIYDKYRAQGFEVIGIVASGDDAKSEVLKILKKTGANWPQRLDRGSDAPVSFQSLYQITAWPTVWLLNKEGVIVDRDARGERLEPLIRKHLGLDDQ